MALSVPSPTRGKGKQKGAATRPPPCSTGARNLLHAKTAAAGAPDVDADEQEQPDHVDEMPVPGGELEAEMLLRREMAAIGADQADDQEHGADQHMEAMEAGRHEEGRAVHISREVEGGVGVFVGLHSSEARTEEDGEDQAMFQTLTIVLEQRVMRPSDCRTRGEQDQRVEQWQV